ncbi:MAG: hypothetical protein RIS92_534 [Verrucomicrobiota bacterium]
MIEGEGELCLGGGLEGFCVGVPDGDDATGAHSEDEGLFWEWDGGGPFEAEGAEVGDGCEGAAGGVVGEASAAREVNEVVVA